MDKIEEFKRRIKYDDDFKKNFEGIKNADDAINIAKQKGYDLKKCTKEDEKELAEDMLESVAGGKNDVEITREIVYDA